MIEKVFQLKFGAEEATKDEQIHDRKKKKWNGIISEGIWIDCCSTCMQLYAVVILDRWFMIKWHKFNNLLQYLITVLKIWSDGQKHK
jgi:hypothetical protein